jgi:hypothetical protein
LDFDARQLVGIVRSDSFRLKAHGAQKRAGIVAGRVCCDAKFTLP